MIPRHRPPFDFGDLLAASLLHSEDVSVEKLEAAYATEFGLPHAILLPSARAGICWALRAATNSESTIVGPAYTCEAVHEAMARSGGRLRLTDTAEDSFLMDPALIVPSQCGNYAVVLSEIYGHTYDSGMSDLSEQSPPKITIFDSAMTVPTPQIFNRLRLSDFAVVSFGLGKCIYAGWGAMGLTLDDGLARDIRGRRNLCLRSSNLGLFVKRAAEICLRTAAHSRCLYGACRIFRGSPRIHPKFPSNWRDDESLSKEWYLPSTAIDRRLALRNLIRCTWFSATRRSLAARYKANLARVSVTPPLSHNALSHYTIRVHPMLRDAIRAMLRRLGVDTGNLFRFASYLSEKEFPNAGTISREVINLPLDANLTIPEVDYISDAVIRCITHLRGQPNYIECASSKT